jgi:leucyl-tRNA synthetase
VKATTVPLNFVLQAEIKADPNFSEDDREHALEQVKDLAEAAKNSHDAEMKNKAKKAARMLGRIISAVPQATKLLEFCNNLLPLITKVFGF